MATTTWTGASSNLFADASNWTDGIPTGFESGLIVKTSADVQVAAGGTIVSNVDLGNTTTLEALGSLAISANGSGLIEGASVPGTDTFTLQIDGGTLSNRGNVIANGSLTTMNITFPNATGVFDDINNAGSFGYLSAGNGGSVLIGSGGTLALSNTAFVTSGGHLTIFSPVMADSFGAGTLEIDIAGTMELGNSVDPTITTKFGPMGNGLLKLDTPANFSSIISGFFASNTVDLTSIASGATGAPGLTFSETGGLAKVTVQKTTSGGTTTAATLMFKDTSGAYAAAGPAGGFVIAGDGGSGYKITTTVACFATGTRIMTTAGAVAVEDLRIGDRVRSAFGGAAPITWIGHRRVDCLRHPRPQDVRPVRIQAGAFGAGQPSADLRLSPDHAVHVAGRLVPVRYLINGASIVQEPAATVTYWHVELPAHDVLMAEDLPCESYLDTGNRAAFAGQPVTMAHPDFALRVWAAESCAPLLIDGPELAEIRVELLVRAEAIGHRATDDAALTLVAHGVVVPALAATDGQMLFDLPAGTTEVRLVSNRECPNRIAPASSDHRQVGVAVASIEIDGVRLDLEDRRLTTGWHASETDMRWTDGDAVIATGQGRRISIHLAMTARYWAAAEAA